VYWLCMCWQRAKDMLLDLLAEKDLQVTTVDCLSLVVLARHTSRAQLACVSASLCVEDVLE